MKKKLLFVYPHMSIGGSTTSLLSILHLIDYSKYDVDLLLGSDKGELLSFIPGQVNKLKQALPSDKVLKFRKMISLRYLYTRAVVRKKSDNVRNQYLTYENARMSRKLAQKYDVAIAFLETYACDYVAKYVNASRKIFWLHTDYIGAGFEKDFDRAIYREFNKIVLVSGSCRENFVKTFPELENRAVVVENILSAAHMREKASEPCDLEPKKECFNLISVCRIDFKDKGLDRGVEAFARLKSEKTSQFCWYIIGDGPVFGRLQEMIAERGLQENIVLLGAKTNPAPYIRKMDCFFLPSRYEGKPMAVTESMMLGVPAFVTRYASADEQISNMKNGIIVENNDSALYNGLAQLIENREILEKMKFELLNTDLTNSAEMEKIYGLINENEASV